MPSFHSPARKLNTISVQGVWKAESPREPEAASLDAAFRVTVT